MHRKHTPDAKRVEGTIRQFPHCDQRILHAPGECEYCDRRPEWQALRLAWGIAFTGYEPDGKELPCPAMHARPETFQVWGGNRPRPLPSVIDAKDATAATDTDDESPR